MKGGTALNLFVQDMPRLSVDIDVTFTDSLLDREAALKAISADLKSARSTISKLGFRATIPTSKSGNELKMLIEGQGAQLKVEVNSILRGTLLPVKQALLTRSAQSVFTAYVALPILHTAELYGGKLVAAMDRQHPRDIFDVKKMLDRFGWPPAFIDCFVAYLASRNRPIHEVLFSRKLPLEHAFSNEFAGMTRDAISLASLEETQKRMLLELPCALTPAHREFLLSLAQAEPDWALISHPRLQQLPAVQWKLLFRKLKASNGVRFTAQHENLADHFQQLHQRLSAAT